MLAVPFFSSKTAPSPRLPRSYCVAEGDLELLSLPPPCILSQHSETELHSPEVSTSEKPVPPAQALDPQTAFQLSLVNLSSTSARPHQKTDPRIEEKHSKVENIYPTSQSISVWKQWLLASNLF